MQTVPFPSYPERHVQVKDPTVLAQIAFTWQLSVLVSHSLISIKKERLGKNPKMQNQDSAVSQ